mmetsp:Transcript_36050/g.106568  ORF Transcript_36050/g.106568 Transcript_36050/m.106568 type:complete len:275 (-) Transcript_36050:432-1256(-)
MNKRREASFTARRHQSDRPRRVLLDRRATALRCSTNHGSYTAPPPCSARPTMAATWNHRLALLKPPQQRPGASSLHCSTNHGSFLTRPPRTDTCMATVCFSADLLPPLATLPPPLAASLPPATACLPPLAAFLSLCCISPDVPKLSTAKRPAAWSSSVPTSSWWKTVCSSSHVTGRWSDVSTYPARASTSTSMRPAMRSIAASMRALRPYVPLLNHAENASARRLRTLCSFTSTGESADAPTGSCRPGRTGRFGKRACSLPSHAAESWSPSTSS